jgi:NAD(P)-dependent dehydrogenase (short-subunit alcohol dehydrogenase family)
MFMTSNASTALVTGGMSGIGFATARKLAQLGIHVLLVGRNPEREKKAVDEIRGAGGIPAFGVYDVHSLALRGRRFPPKYMPDSDWTAGVAERQTLIGSERMPLGSSLNPD